MESNYTMISKEELRDLMEIRSKHDRMLGHLEIAQEMGKRSLKVADLLDLLTDEEDQE